MPHPTLPHTAAPRLAAILLAILVSFIAITALTTQTARAATLSPESFGVNLRLMTANNQLQPGNLSVGSASGLGVARVPIDQGANADAIVALTAAAHIRLYPELGLPTAESPAAAATDMAQFVTSFAQRYGPGGSFWSQNPNLPYFPVRSYEIGNEPNLPLKWVADTTHLHWADPAAYAQVYAASRTALHQVDQAGIAVVGGLADSASGGVDVTSDEQWLSALTGPVDAVGYHPYTYVVSNALMQTDTASLRAWFDAHGMTAVPLDVNEFGACDITPSTTDNSQCRSRQTSAQWGAAAASYTQWAVCTPALNVESVQPFYWGATARTDADVWLSLVNGDQTLTPFGQAYLGQAHALTTSGCPDLLAQNMSRPTISGAMTVGAQLTADPGFWTGNPAPTLSYQWERCDATGQNCHDIAGATSTGYTFQSADTGSTIAVRVGAQNAAGMATSSSTPPQTPAAASTPAAGAPVVATPTKSTGASATPRRPSGTTATAKLASVPRARLQLVRVISRGHRLSVAVRIPVGSLTARVTAYSRGKHHGAIRLRLTRRDRRHTLAEFAARLAPGRWTLIASATAVRGYATPGRAQRLVRISA